ncbi:hypothetical protein M422DRAFT_53568 [Sphaerobolus stellatus SS14]|uniref:Uncharacterized protein n=1 Tax=Sphaerobolus stellatus (strain SS14) TaxID=990650 RepID=A0A0C9UPL5_SPHS4|nr:hypothetical protein M422DRAFT_53568 [Sphaerobolus stellatus SS14]
MEVILGVICHATADSRAEFERHHSTKMLGRNPGAALRNYIIKRKQSDIPLECVPEEAMKTKSRRVVNGEVQEEVEVPILARDIKAGLTQMRKEMGLPQIQDRRDQRDGKSQSEENGPIPEMRGNGLMWPAWLQEEEFSMVRFQSLQLIIDRS